MGVLALEGLQGPLSKGIPPFLESIMLPPEEHPTSDSQQVVSCQQWTGVEFQNVPPRPALAAAFLPTALGNLTPSFLTCSFLFSFFFFFKKKKTQKIEPRILRRDCPSGRRCHYPLLKVQNSQSLYANLRLLALPMAGFPPHPPTLRSDHCSGDG